MILYKRKEKHLQYIERGESNGLNNFALLKRKLFK